MQSPFRKLVRISVILFATVLLFNFFGYYLANRKSAENEALIAARSLSGRQQTLSQVIAKQAAVLTGGLYGESETKKFRDSLSSALASFKIQEKQLQKTLGQPGILLPARVFEIRLLLSYVNPYYNSIVRISDEILGQDSLIFGKNKRLYLREILESESKYLPLMRDITNQFTVILSEKTNEKSAIEIGKFLSLIIAIICMIILVLEPAFRRGEKNFRDLQDAKNELQVEKTHLNSLLQSQTNYLVRIDRMGKFSYANAAFLKSFGYGEEQVLDKVFFTMIFPEDVRRCREVAKECWEKPGSIVKLLIRKPISHSREFIWTDWEFLALSDDRGLVKEIQGIGIKRN